MFFAGAYCGSCARILFPQTAVNRGSATGGARFVGNATPIAGIPVSRLLNAACYIIAGIAGLVLSTQPGMPKAWSLLLGLAAIGYGIKIVATRTAYWVNSLVYFVALAAVVGTFGVFAR